MSQHVSSDWRAHRIAGEQASATMQNTPAALRWESNPRSHARRREAQAAFRGFATAVEPFAFGTRGARAASSDAIPLARGRSRSVIVESQGGLLRELTRQESNLREADAFENPLDSIQDRVCLAMVGLPARGKSYISKAIIRYLNFIGCPAKLFNAGNKRRAEGLAGTDASFFDASNASAKAQREEIAMETLDELLAWLHGATTGWLRHLRRDEHDGGAPARRRRALRARVAARDAALRRDDLRRRRDPHAQLPDEARQRRLPRRRPGEGADRLQGARRQVRGRVPAARRRRGGGGRPRRRVHQDGQRRPQARRLALAEPRRRVEGALTPPLRPPGPPQDQARAGRRDRQRPQGLLGGDSPLSNEGLEYTRAVAAHVRQRERELRDEEEGDEARDWATRRTKGIATPTIRRWCSAARCGGTRRPRRF